MELRSKCSKTEHMCIGGEQQNLIHCKMYRYLGIRIFNDGNLVEEIKHRDHQRRRVILQLNSILWDKTISIENKRRIYNSIVKSIVTYGSEIWPLQEKAIKTLEATEMNYLRRVTAKSRLDRLRIERIQEIMGVKPNAHDFGRINQLRWSFIVIVEESKEMLEKLEGWRRAIEEIGLTLENGVYVVERDRNGWGHRIVLRL
ncbi:uncharacterized protein [Diabrotica undecimpunctata]|uniref:uncharacterized protein n=1 Tax=Diabrotica undecimpunctata TaxID=50387 RepID=UPI003B64248D